MIKKLARSVSLAAAVLAAVLLSPPSDATTVISPDPKLRFEDNNGNPCTGCKVFTYAAGSTTKVVTYTDSTGGTANADPIILDTRGEADVWLTPGTAYKFTLAPANDTDPPTNPIWTVDQVVGLAGIGSLVAGSGISINGNVISLATIPTGSVLCNTSGSTAAPSACSISSLVPRSGTGGGPVTYYLSPTGTDTGNCLTVPTACRTPNYVQSLISALDLSGGGSVTVNLADGNYDGWTAEVWPPGCGGPSCITWIGNTTTPANVTVTGLSAIVADKSGVAFTIKGMTLAGNGLAANGSGYGLYVANGASVQFDKIVFAACNNAQIFAGLTGQVSLAAASATYSITGGAPSHLVAQNTSNINIGGATVTLSGTPAFSTAFAVATQAANILTSSVSFSGSATGKRYDVSLNAVINTGTNAGNVDNSFLPGNASGTSASGGYYN